MPPACRGLERAALAFVCAGNAIIHLRSSASALLAPQHFAGLAWVAPPFILLAALELLPSGTYLRLRTWLVPLLRLAFHRQPSERSATVRRAAGARHAIPPL